MRGAWEKGLQCGQVAEHFQHTHLFVYVHFTHTELFLVPAELLAVVWSSVARYPVPCFGKPKPHTLRIGCSICHSTNPASLVISHKVSLDLGLILQIRY